LGLITTAVFMVLELGEELGRVDLEVGEDAPIGVEEGGYVVADEVGVAEQDVTVDDHELIAAVVGGRGEPDIDMQLGIRRLAAGASEHLKHRSIIW
jgi:hypothetical protein